MERHGLLAQGDRAGTLTHYRNGLAIGERLTARDPGNADGQLRLAGGIERIGDVLMAQDDRRGALDAYERRYAIIDRLAAANPRNGEWQRHLSISLRKVGDALLSRGEVQTAVQSYHRSHVIAERLAAADPTNGAWQRDLIVSAVRIAELPATLGGGGAEAAGHYREALARARGLAETGRLVPADAWMPAFLKRRLAAVEGPAPD